MSARVVELCGLPGSGKTTVARYAVDAVRAGGRDCAVADARISAAATKPARVVRRAGAAVREVGRHPVASVAALRAVAGTGDPALRDVTAGLAQWLAVRDIIARAQRSPQLSILEEGLVQTLWTLTLRAPHDPSPHLWRRLGADSLPDLVVLLDVSPDLAAARLEARQSRHSRTQLLDAEERTAELEHGQELLERLLEHCPVPVLRVVVDDAVPAASTGASVAELLLAEPSPTAARHHGGRAGPLRPGE